MSTSSRSPRHILHPNDAEPGERTAAAELARALGGTVLAADAAANTGGRSRGITVTLARRGLPKGLPARAKDTSAWMWLRLADDDTGEIVATHGSFLFCAARLIATHSAALPREKLAGGIWLPATFGFHRPHWDACFTQYWRSARGFDPEHYAATLAESGFTHAEVNGLQAHMPYEDLAPFEYYPQFYTYGPGFNHFVETPLTAGIWPALYLDANLEHLKKLAEIVRRY